MEEIVIMSKSAATVYFFLVYCAILFWVLRGKNRKRLEEHRHIPFRED
ncbi:MAG TPA: cbb3-type cytochrome c oxidase subunit 3 [Deltaproteobacteria bacterium]|nr:cbb3-type cytochrome c oxidase subunit 3 [Deltaproteobacteria bacterium]